MPSFKIKDPNTKEVIHRILIRDQQGMKKFKKTMREINKSPVKWLEEAIEGSIDNLRYLIEAVNRLKKNKSKK